MREDSKYWGGVPDLGVCSLLEAVHQKATDFPIMSHP